MKQDEKQALINAQWNIVNDREARLASKDYIGTKIAMEVSTVSEYEAEIAETEVWRSELNAAQDEIKRLEAIEVEPDEPEVEPEESEE